MIEIVIDADVARSSGLTENPVSSSCRKLLDLVKDNGHNAVYCSKLKEEWNVHQSKYFSDWFTLMFSKNRIKKIKHQNKIHETIKSSNTCDNTKKIALKDSHLLDIALLTSKSIASKDENAKKAFSIINEIQNDIKDICWINPVTEIENLPKILFKDTKNIANDYKPFKSK